MSGDNPHDPEGLERPRWQDVLYEIRKELEGVGVNEALFEGHLDDPICQEAIQRIEAEPLTRREFRAWMKAMSRDIENDAMIKDLEMDLNRPEEPSSDE